MSAAWLTPPVQLHSSRMFECDGFTEEQCTYYRYPWHFWYESDHVFALPTVAFFMCAIGVFIIGNVLIKVLQYTNNSQSSSIWRRILAATRYLSYRGFHIERFCWNSASVGVLILGAVGAVFFFCMDLIPQPYYWPSLDWGSSPPLATRSGWMALACLPFVFATASKTSWITFLTGVTHEKIQVFHRWIGYAFFLLSLLHTFPFIVFHIRHHDMVMQFEMGLIFYWTGIAAIILQAWLTFASFGPLRSLGYEFFRTTHFLAVVLFVLILFWHCDYTLSSWDYFIATAAVYVPCLVYPWLRTIFEHGLGQKAQLFVEENGFTQITIPAHFDWVPGQHCFLRFRGFGIHALSSHPFTICSLPSLTSDQSHVTFYIRHRGGFTARLYRYAMQHPGVMVPVLVDGPYGGIDPAKFHDSDRAIVVAGGSGAGWCLPFIEQYIRCHRVTKSSRSSSNNNNNNGKGSESDSSNDDEDSATVGPRLTSLHVILATRDTSTRVWFHKTIKELLARYDRSDATTDLTVEVYLTGEADSPREIRKGLKETNGSVGSTSSDEEKVIPHETHNQQVMDNDVPVREELHGRPDLPQIIREEAAKTTSKGHSLSVFACGPLTMQNDVRNAVARTNLEILRRPKSGGVYLHLEHFSWA